MSQVSDFNVANASGASVRADINAILDAIKTNNAGGTDPSNPEAFMFYADTLDSNKLKIRNSANNGFTDIGLVNEPNLGLLPKAGGTMTGQLKGDDASVAASPAYSFDQDPDTGMYRTAANKIGFATAGAERAIFDDFGLSIENQGHVAFREQSSNGASGVTVKAPASLGGDINLTLPSTIVNGGYLQTNASGVLSFQIIEGVPTGAVFCIAVATVPTGYVECDGQSYNRTGTYAALFAIIGTTYGANNSSTFKVPDLRGEFVRGYDHGRGVDNGRSINDAQGDQNKQHDHSISLSGTTSNKSLTGTIRKISETFNSGGGTAGGIFSKTGGENAANTPSRVDSSPAAGVNLDASHDHTFSASGTSGQNGGSEARPRNIAMMYVIKI